MDINFEQKVREKAYEIWMSAGMEDGAAHDHWVTAEQVVMNETVQPAKKATAKKPAAKPAGSKAASAKKPAASKTVAKAPKAKTKH